MAFRWTITLGLMVTSCPRWGGGAMQSLHCARLGGGHWRKEWPTSFFFSYFFFFLFFSMCPVLLSSGQPKSLFLHFQRKRWKATIRLNVSLAPSVSSCNHVWKIVFLWTCVFQKGVRVARSLIGVINLSGDKFGSFNCLAFSRLCKNFIFLCSFRIFQRIWIFVRISMLTIKDAGMNFEDLNI